MSSSTRRFVRLLCLLPLLGASLAFAADKPASKQSSFGGAKGTGPALTREQLRKCLAQQDTVKTQDADLAREQAALNDRKVELTGIGDELKNRLDGIDRTNAEAVDRYNEAVQSRDKQIDEYQARVAKFNANVEASQVARAQFTQGCSNRRYLEDDETAIRKDK